MIASRLFRVALVLAAGVVSSRGLAATPALVVDVDSGKVLYADRATDPWFPASITKLMTTYVALDLVRQGRASMDQLLTVSPLAAAEPPSKMGFKPGTQVTLDNALKIIMVKSANDVSWTIAEGLGGSVEGFAAMMNDAARRIGMRESVWTNPNGLPDDRQRTSARDMAILGRALLREFPERRELFSISAIQFGRRVMANHNGLLGRYPGVDGMKTGFICSGGFNVVASATRDGRRLITVVMGSTTARERTHKAAELFDRGFSLSSFGGQALEELPASTVAEPRNMRPVVCERHKPEPEEDAEIAAVAPGAAPESAGLNLFAAPSSALAFAGMNAASWQNRALPPRAPLQPILVWTGQDPAESRIAADAAEPAPKVKGRRPKVADTEQAAPAKKRGLRARVDAAMEAAQAAPSATPTIMEGLPKPAPARPAQKPAAVASTPAQAPKPAGAKPGAIGAAGDARTTASTKPGAIAAKPAAQSKPPAVADKSPAKPAPTASAAAKPAVAKKPVASAGAGASSAGPSSSGAPKTKTAVVKAKPKADE